MISVSYNHRYYKHGSDISQLFVCKIFIAVFIKASGFWATLIHSPGVIIWKGGKHFCGNLPFCSLTFLGRKLPSFTWSGLCLYQYWTRIWVGLIDLVLWLMRMFQLNLLFSQCAVLINDIREKECHSGDSGIHCITWKRNMKLLPNWYILEGNE